MGTCTSASWLWINCECGGIIRNDIFPDTLSVQIPLLFSFSVTDEILTFSPEVCYSLSQNCWDTLPFAKGVCIRYLRISYLCDCCNLLILRVLVIRV